MIGPRDGGVPYAFMQDLAGRLTNRVDLTTDGLQAYIDAVEGAFGTGIDCARLVKLYGEAPNSGPERRCRPNVYLGARPTTVAGNPDMAHVSTSYAERQNPTMRMRMRRVTRLTNGFSKKLENLGHALALHFMYYNFGRIHQSLRVTPAMAASISDHGWELEEIVALCDH